MHKRFNFNTFFLNSKSPQKKEKRKKKKEKEDWNVRLYLVANEGREEKRREMSKRKPFSHICLEIEKRKEKNALLFPLFSLQKRKETKRKICHFTFMPA